jgi:hypothetical protein
MAVGYNLAGEDGPLDSTYFSNLESFQVHYPDFQLEDKLLVEGGDVMWGEIYYLEPDYST